MSVSNMPPIDRAEQSTAHEIQQAKVIDLNDGNGANLLI